MEILHHIESAQWLAAGDLAIEITGWCFSPMATLIAVSAYTNGKKIAQAELAERRDVQRFHQENPHALRSGFKIHLPLLDLENVIELRATDGTASSAFFSVRAGDLPKRGAIQVDYASWSNVWKAQEAATPAPTMPMPAPTSEKSRPLVSLLLPVYNTPPRFLTECLESVLQQSYPDWELRIVDDGSTQLECRELLAQAAKRDARIHVETLPKNRGIAHATNQALASARGEFVGCLDHDDRLHPEALAQVVARLVTTGATAAYTDEEKITAEGVPCLGVFKPDFSPELLCGVMYLGHFLCVRTAAARAIGGFNARFDGIQDFEFALRLSEYSPAIEHLPRILYQWRMSPASSAQQGNVKGDMDRLQAEAVTQHLARTGRSASVESLGAHRLRVLPRSSSPRPRSLLIARHSRCVEKIGETGAEEVSVLSNVSLADLIQLLERSSCDRVLWLNEPIVAPPATAFASLLGFLDAPTVGAVAPTLLATDGKILAAGAIVTSRGKVVAAMRGFARDSDGYNGSLVCNREVSALPAACVAFRKKELLENLGQNTHPFTDAGMAALCLALRRRGLRVLTSGAWQFETYQHWSGRGILGEVAAAKIDPYYPVQCNADHGDYRLGALPQRSP